MNSKKHWTKTKRNMIRIQDYVEAHLTEKITAKDVAERLGLNYQTVHVQFCEFCGVGIGEYISDRRMEHAAAELAEGAEVGAVLRKYCYATHSAFAKAFRKRFGISPRECREGKKLRRRQSEGTLQELRRRPELYHQSSEYLELIREEQAEPKPEKRSKKSAKCKPEDLVFEEYQFHPVFAMVRGVPYVDRKTVQMRDYILEHYNEDITPRSVIEHFGEKHYNNMRSSFTIRMGESMSSMIRRLRAEHAEEKEETRSVS